MVKLSFYVPPSHLEIVKQAVFDTGAGRMGHYANCAWQVLGEGQFMPLSSSRPFAGKHNESHSIAEFLVEMVCEDRCVQAAISALKAAHPYEEPAYGLFPMLDPSAFAKESS